MKKKSMLIVAILLMSIGFAAISTTLIINGNAKVSENNEDFSVIFTAASIDGNDVYSTAVDETKKTITFTTSELKTLNQTSILTYEVTNNSSNYDANVNVTCVPSTGTTAKYTSIKNKLENDATVVKAKETLNGTLTVTLDQVATEAVTEEYTCKLVLNAIERDTIKTNSVSFASDSWKLIAKNVKNKDTLNYKIGDTREVDLGSFGKHTLRIANLNECVNGETSETACGFVVEFADIITEHSFDSTYTKGGWRNSEIREYLNGTIFESLPEDLQNVITTTKVISDYNGTKTDETQDRLYLLTMSEIYVTEGLDYLFGSTRQLDYYKTIGVDYSTNSSGAIKQYNGSDYKWMLRYSGDGKYNFSVNSIGGCNQYDTDVTSGISPAFRIA